MLYYYVQLNNGDAKVSTGLLGYRQQARVTAVRGQHIVQMETEITLQLLNSQLTSDHSLLQECSTEVLPIYRLPLVISLSSKGHFRGQLQSALSVGVVVAKVNSRLSLQKLMALVISDTGSIPVISTNLSRCQTWENSKF